jgi:hypothetical protein
MDVSILQLTGQTDACELCSPTYSGGNKEHPPSKHAIVGNRTDGRKYQCHGLQRGKWIVPFDCAIDVQQSSLHWRPRQWSRLP